VDAEEIDFDGGEGVVADADGDWDAGDEGAEFAFFVVRCAETDVPVFFVVGCQEGPYVKCLRCDGVPFEEGCGVGETECGALIFNVMTRQ